MSSNTANKNNNTDGIYTNLAELLNTRHWAKELDLFSRQAARSMLLGETRSRFRGRGMEFEEVRPYQAGDDIRTIDWRVSARTGETYTKLFCEEHERPVHVIADQRNSLFFVSQIHFKSVLTANIAAAIAWAALAGSDRIGGQIISEYKNHDIRAKRNRQAVLKFIHDLTAANEILPIKHDAEKTPHSMADTIKECRRITRPGTAIFIISDFNDFDDAAAQELSLLGRHSDISLMQVADPLEENLPLAGNVAISDGNQQLSVLLNKGTQKRYQQTRQARAQLLKQAAIRARAMYTSFSTNDSVRKELSRIFNS